MQAEQQPQVGSVQARNNQPGDAQAAYAAGSAPSAPRRRPWRRPFLMAAIVLAVLAAAAAVLTYVRGGFNDDGRFRAEPPPCAALEPSVHLLGTTYTLQQAGSNNCQLMLPQNHPDYVAAPKIEVYYKIITSPGKDAPDAASQELRRVMREPRPLPGVGDEAYRWSGGLALRVSNLVVGIVVHPRQASTEEQLQAFAADLADRLGES
ncbi:hypothetical protein [Micromonospora sp. NPDC005707]|uniref:hypothetical protein n=1 Tax=Micromonospora sp. NPDC005707 TaxID=3157050 RepID=UPI0033F5ECE4